MSDALLVLVESNTSGTGQLFLEAATAADLRPVLLTADPARYPFSAECADVQVVDTSSPQSVLTACRRLASDGRLVGVTTSSEYYAEVVATVARRLGLAANPASAVATARDKACQRRHLNGSLPQPAFVEARTPPEAVEAARGLGLPVVVKPVAGSGSVGVRSCSTVTDVRLHAEALLAVTTNERGLPVRRCVLVEEAVSGEEYSVEIFAGRVIGVTRKHLGPPPTFVEIGHDFPAVLPAADRRRLTETAVAAVRALGLRRGPAHVELRMAPNGPVLIEVNPRLAGGWIPRLIEVACGVDLIAATVRAAAGEPFSLIPVRNKAAAIRFVVPHEDGRLVSVPGKEAAARVQGLVEVSSYRQAGEQIRLRGDFRDRIGHVLTTATAVEAAARTAEHALRLIQPRIQLSHVEGRPT